MPLRSKKRDNMKAGRDRKNIFSCRCLPPVHVYRTDRNSHPPPLLTTNPAYRKIRQHLLNQGHERKQELQRRHFLQKNEDANYIERLGFLIFHSSKKKLRERTGNKSYADGS